MQTQDVERTYLLLFEKIQEIKSHSMVVGSEWILLSRL